VPGLDDRGSRPSGGRPMREAAVETTRTRITTATARRRRTRRTLCAAGVLALCVAASACSSAAQTASGASGAKVTFGCVCDLSGDEMSLGQAFADGLKLAVKEINSKGGFAVAGQRYEINLVIKDGQSQPTASVAAARDLVQSQNVRFLFGPDSDDTSLQVLGVTASSGALQFAGGAADQSVIGTPGHKLQFGVVLPISVWEGAAVPALRSMGVHSGTVALMYPDNSAGQGLAPLFAQLLEQNGYQAKTFLFPVNTTDFKAIVARVKASGAVAILDGYDAQWGLPIAQAAVQLNAVKGIVAVNQPASAVPLAIAKSLGKPFPLLWASLPNNQQLGDPTTPGMRALRKLWVASYHIDPASTVALNSTAMYWSVNMLVAAMQKARTVTDTKAIAGVLQHMTFHGNQTVHFNSHNVAVFGLDYGIMSNGVMKWTYLPPSGGS
jgi:ABC-type branched-subunit amino acid transport system substrate-binding protein